MKAQAVSALRSKRGLRPEMSREAEPQVVGLAPQTTNDRRANTMKTYLLRDPKTVETQNPQRNPLRRDPAVTATVEGICGRPASAPPVLAGRVLFIGLDVHNDSIAVSLAPSDATEVRRYGMIGGNTRTCSSCSRSCRPRIRARNCGAVTRPGRGGIRSAGLFGRTGARA